MGTGAWIMFAIGATVLWGGLGYFLWVAYRSKKEAA
ncbi:MetS family NSS transporter small subunit [Desmospora profundinema]|uniref:MetS family NSS transporter small subunit n=1 Tax=Desmospora profundinema TaxID=1571184 RepID=A0ABU1IN77_9BACL|nr:MetS family NSS transporter small subunit [Desmospora profundinema]MDR6226227.1 hypothetical protein [Desmospora profundinema]